MKIDLGMSYEGMPKSSKMSDEHFPSFTYDGPEKLDLPEEGVMKIRYRKVRSSESKMGDHTMHSCTVEVKQILGIKGAKSEAEAEAPTKKYSGAEDALDALMKEKMAEKEDY